MGLGQIRGYYLKYAFELYIQGLGYMGFATCSEATSTLGEALLWQGGSLIPVKEPTRLTFADITLERGASRDNYVWEWLKQAGDATVRSGFAGRGAAKGTQSFLQKHIQVIQKNRAGVTVETVNFFNCQPREVSLGDWNNDADEFRIERLIFAYDWFDRTPVPTTPG